MPITPFLAGRTLRAIGVFHMQTILLSVVMAIAIVAMSFGITLSVIDNGVAATVSGLVRLIDP
jgi:hypothetical protein